MSQKASNNYRFAAAIRVAKTKGISYRRALGGISSHERSKVRIKETAKLLQIDITAKDAAALRASLNSMLKDLHVVESVSTL